ncbi:MAG: aminoglycoside 6-adenylyltransferase [Clostridiaceae bacterium]|nr:aminoglycoside 6-adenylyltransferase [Clostridiaceae bacterium]
MAYNVDRSGEKHAKRAEGDRCWHIEPPSSLFYYSCRNNFWWCLNNVAKGIMCDELPHVMHMLNEAEISENRYLFAV